MIVINKKIHINKKSKILVKNKISKIKDENEIIIQNAGDSVVGDIEKVVIDSSNNLKSNVNREMMKNGIMDNNEYLMYRAIPFDSYISDLNEVNKYFKIAFDLAGESIILTLPLKYRDIKFKSSIERAVNITYEQGAKLVREVSTQTVQAIQDEIARSLKMGFGVDRTADNIIDLIGLTRRQSLAVHNYGQRLIEEGYKLNKVSEMVNEYSIRSLKLRAENIARTESMRSANNGAMELYNQLYESGLLEENVKKVWIVTHDDRLCEYCRPMHNQKKELNEMFESSLENIMNPPLHPRCRCVIGLEFEK